MTTKIAVSLPDEQVEAARQAVTRGEAASVSSFVSEAIAQRQRATSLRDVVLHFIAEDGEPSAEDYAWADRALGLA